MVRSLTNQVAIPGPLPVPMTDVIASRVSASEGANQTPTSSWWALMPQSTAMVASAVEETSESRTVWICRGLPASLAAALLMTATTLSR